jgi:predicted glycosyltransferase
MNPKKILFYSHDTFGLGHIQRVLAIGRTIDRRHAVLIVSGSGFLPRLEIPPEIDVVKLPTVTKVGEDRYRSKSLPLPLSAVIRIRGRLLRETVRSFQPDIFVVDNVPLGLRGEALAALEELRSNRPACRIFLTLRDILDDPEKIIWIWRRDGVYRALERYYDAVLVFGLREIYDVTREYQIPAETAARFRFCGYIDKGPPRQPAENLRRRMGINGGSLVLVTAGGGGDGAPLVEASMETLAAWKDENLRAIVVLGPDFPHERERRLRRAYSGNRRISMSRFLPRLPEFIQASDLVISMGGYNTVSEILSLGKPAIIVPRIFPRREQLIRAERLSGPGRFAVIHPDGLSPQSLAVAMDAQLGRRRDDPSGIDMQGLRRSGEFFREMLAG